MPLTSRIGIPIPREGADPWYDAFVDYSNALDASLFASREDRQIFLKGGGTFTFSASTNLLSWDDTIEMTAAIAGFLWRIPAGSVTINDGYFLYADLVRAPTDNKTLTVSTGPQVPSSDAAIAIAFRSGTSIYFRNGRILFDGSSATVLEFETTEGGGSGSDSGLISGQTTLGFAAGDFGYVSANNAWTKAKNNGTFAEATVAGVSGGLAGTMLIPGNVVPNAKFTTAGGLPSPGAEVYLAASTEDASTGTGKLTATVPTAVGTHLTVVGVCVDNSNYAGFGTAKIIFNPRSPELL